MKKFLIVCFIAAMALGFASCSKDSDDSTPSSLVGTTWQADNDPQTLVIFSTATAGTVSRHGESGQFTYTYNDGSGTMTLRGGTGTFTVKGDKMTITAPNGKSETFTQISGGNGGGGSAVTSLVNTSWSCLQGNKLTRICFVSASNVTIYSYVNGELDVSFNTTYIYNGSNGTGILFAPPGEEGDINFTVSGNTLTIEDDGHYVTFNRD